MTGDLGAAAAAIGVSRWTVQNWVKADGGIKPRRREATTGTPRLSFEDRVSIEVMLAEKTSVRAIADQVGAGTVDDQS